MPEVPLVALDRAVCGDLAAGEAREWLVTNGLGGFGSGTVAGTLTRRYHGLLFSARTPPVGRTLLCPKIDAELDHDGVTYALAADRWRDGTLAPRGYVYLTGFWLEGTVPVWTFTCGEAVLERRVWMEHGANRTYVAWHVVRARAAVRLLLRAFANRRDLHGATHAGDWMMDVRAEANGVRVLPSADESPLLFRADRGSWTAEHVWYRDFEYAAERERGLDDSEDHLRVATCEAVLAAGEGITLAVEDGMTPAIHDGSALAVDDGMMPSNDEATPSPDDGRLPPLDGAAALGRRHAHDDALLAVWQRAHGSIAEAAPGWVRQLVRAADAFVVRRPLAEEPDALSLIAGYHWFGAWGRDTAIALPGLALATGRPEVARTILATLARFVADGMLPNVLPDCGAAAQYNTVDAGLWYIEAVRRYFDACEDLAALRGLWPALRAIVAAYVRGTRFGIAVDPRDGLLRAGEPGLQLTWMDAKVGDWVVTPRIGKPVEINALWIAAMRTCARLAPLVGADPRPYAATAARAEASFGRFWNDAAGCCFDVLDGPEGDDASIRPNQLFAVALPVAVLDEARRRAIVDVCAARLWTPAGLRSLDPRDPRYAGHYGGPQLARDGAYHQGTVWTWLAGPFALAYRRVSGDVAGALGLLAATGDALAAAGLGTLGEIADGDAPFAPRGTIAQAWSVATILDAWHTLSNETAVTA